MANKQELAFRAIESDDVSLAILEAIKTINAVRTISTPNIGEIAIITTAINDLIAQLKRVSDAMKAMMDDSGRASMEETLTRGLTNIINQQNEVINLLKNVSSGASSANTIEQKKIANGPLVAGREIGKKPESKAQPKVENSKTPLYKDYAILGVVVVVSMLAGILLKTYLKF